VGGLIGDAMPEQDLNPSTATPAWYVVHTYSGYENKVKDNLEKAAENNRMQHLIQEVQVPMEEVAEIKNGKRITTQHKTFPGYVLVKMIITSESWYVVRNTRGVTGFVGPESKPVPLTDIEFETMMKSQPQAEATKLVVGEEIRIISGPLENFNGTVEAVDVIHGKLQVKVKMFLGREMQVEIDLDQAEKV
jgi:transcriptional antiterminator NusG